MVSVTPLIKPKPKIIFHKLADIQTEEVNWLWYPYIPAGKLTVLEGDPGLGKSWITCAIASDISTGRKLPGSKADLPPQKVLMLSAEDGLGDTVKPRIESMKGNVENIFVSDSHFSLDSAGLKELEELMRSMAATIVFLDPIVAYLGGKMDMNKANEVRAMMGPLAEAAKNTGSSIVIVRHLRKSGGGNAKYNGLGSIDFTAAVRSGLMVGESKGGTRYMRQFKNNLAPTGDSLAYSLVDSHFQWEGNFEDTDDDAPAKETSRHSMTDKAQEFLFDNLKNGPMSSIELMSRAAEAGLNTRTLDRAKKGVAMSRKIGDTWEWMLLEHEGMGR